MLKQDRQADPAPGDENTASHKIRKACYEMLNAALSMTGADFGSVQLVSADGASLELVAQRGFNLNFLEHFKSVPVECGSSVCSRAAQERHRIAIEDVESDSPFKKHLEIARSVPFRAVQATPLVSGAGKLLGVLSTYSREPRLPDENQLKELDSHLVHASVLIENLRIESPETIRPGEKVANENWILHSTKFFQGLSDDDKKSMLDISSIRDYPKETVIFQHGDGASRMFIVLSGWIKIYNINHGARESGIMLFTQGDDFGAESIFDGGAYLYSSVAETKSQLLELPADGLKKIVRNNPDIAANVMQALSDEIKDRRIAEACSRHKMASQRVVCLLLRLSSWMKGRGGTFPMPYRKAVAAAQLDMDQCTFSRAISGMGNMGISTKESEITIDDFAVLSEHCCTDCPFSIGGACGGTRLKGQAE